VLFTLVSVQSNLGRVFILAIFEVASEFLLQPQSPFSIFSFGSHGLFVEGLTGS